MNKILNERCSKPFLKNGVESVSAEHHNKLVANQQ